MHLQRRLGQRLKSIARLQWKGSALTLRERFREDRLALTAGSLTFTTTIALVPLLTVVLAVFSAFPMFGQLQIVPQKWLVQSLVPTNIARQVLGYITQFSGQANRLGAIGLVFLFVSALALIMTIDRTLNAIWRVRSQRPLAQRMLIYWSGMTLGPLLLGASVTMTSYALSASTSVVGGLPGGVSFLLDLIQYLLLAWGAAAMYHFVPNTHVKWSHAWTGGLFVATAMAVARKLLVVYLGKVPTFSVLYGTFATVPILLVWIYLAWLIVLLGAVITAYLPSLHAGMVRRDLGDSWRFQLALEALRLLRDARGNQRKGLTLTELARALQESHLGIESALEALVELDWAARLDSPLDQDEARYVMLANPDSTRLEPLIRMLLLRHSESTEKLWRSAGWSTLLLAEVL
ncbi:MAG: YihY family inner membrane protein [Burkholderiaceae bacterium]